VESALILAIFPLTRHPSRAVGAHAAASFDTFE